MTHPILATILLAAFLLLGWRVNLDAGENSNRNPGDNLK